MYKVELQNTHFFKTLFCVFCFVFCNFFSIYLFIFIFWLCWVFVSVQGLSLVVASRGHPSSRCAGLSPSRPLLLRSTGSRRAGSAVVAHGPSRSTACGIFPDQGSNPRPLHWQADSQPLCHQGSPLHSLNSVFCRAEVLNFNKAQQRFFLSFLNILFIIYLFIYFWLCPVFVAACGIFSCGMWAS